MNELTSIFDLTKLNAFDKTGKINENYILRIFRMSRQGFLSSTHSK